MPPKPREISRASAPITSAPGTPEWIPAPATAPTDRNAVAWIRPSASTPASWPTSSALRLNGVSARRLRKPDSTSLATLVPALFAANSPPWTKQTASTKSR